MKEKKPSSTAEEKESQRKIKTMDLILIVIGIALLTFTIVMIWIFRSYGSIPDTLCTCFFAAVGGECGIMGWIKTTKERQRERTWEIDDRNHQEKLAKEVDSIKEKSAHKEEMTNES